MDRALTGRMPLALAALALALAAHGAAMGEWESSLRSVYEETPDSPSHPLFEEIAGFTVGMAKVCQKFRSMFLGDGRIDAIRTRFSGRENFDREVERMRRTTHGADVWRGSARPYCNDTGRQMDLILAALEREKAAPAAPAADEKPLASDIIFHAEMRGGDPFGLLSRLTLDAMPDTLFVRNVYRRLVSGKPYVRRVSFYDPQGRHVASDQYHFTPASRRWNVWHRFDAPARRFRKPGDWRIVTRLSGGEFEVETSRVLPVEGRAGGIRLEPRLEKARLSCHSADRRELFARVLAREGGNTEAADELRARCAGEFVIKIDAELADLPRSRHFYHVQIRQPDGAIAGTDGLHFPVENTRREVQTAHSMNIDDIISRPGDWKILFFVDSEKVGERTVRIAR